jgi:membrane-bound serine protease (ClpP class)
VPARAAGDKPAARIFTAVKKRFVRALLVSLVIVGAVTANAFATGPRVLAVEFKNDVNPVTADYVTSQIDRANRDHYSAIVIQLDTPGGLSDAMRDIYQAELRSKVPVIVYVSPAGARAASAGVWIGQAADILAMAPQTNIGSSTPIDVGGGNIQSDLRRKIINDAAASLQTLAKNHGRNAQWARLAVTRASNLTEYQALQRHVVDVVAPSLPALLKKIDGRKTVPKGIVLHTAGAEVTQVHMSLWKRILDTLIDPNLILLMMTLGVLGITIEILHPGLIFPGTFGAISLITAMFGLQVLPVSWAGVLLMVLAAGFFVADLYLPTHGALTLAGLASFIVGALMLFDPAGSAYSTSVWVVLAIAGTVAVLFAFTITKVVQARRAKPQTGIEELRGEIGIVRRQLDPEGIVFVHGELWRARSTDGTVGMGEQVRVEGIGDDLRLDVVPARTPVPAA